MAGAVRARLWWLLGLVVQQHSCVQTQSTSAVNSRLLCLAPPWQLSADCLPRKWNWNFIWLLWMQHWHSLCCVNFLNQVDLIVFQLYFATPSSITARWLWLLFGKIYLVVIIVTDPDTYHIQNQSRHSQTFDTGHSTMDGWCSAGNIPLTQL